MPPKASVVRYDGDDPYLVVAAGQGHGHVLGHRQRHLSRRIRLLAGRRLRQRAGRHGYDHKKMGDHGARRMGGGEAPLPRAGPRHPEPKTFTAVGIGDMSGDVFGNAMLLSAATSKLVGAFNHLPRLRRPRSLIRRRAGKERERLFALPRSSWSDYDAKLISAGRRGVSTQRQIDRTVRAGLAPDGCPVRYRGQAG